MHIYKTIKNFLIDQEYYIDFWQENIHIYGFKKIDALQENRAVFVLENFTLEILGNDFRVLKLTNKEILLHGNLKEMRVL